MGSLAELVCGKPEESERPNRLSLILTHLSKTLDGQIQALKRLTTSAEEDFTMFAPGLGRGILEVAFTGIAARLDPIRMIWNAEVQQGPNYDPGLRRYSSVRWAGDIVLESSKQVIGADVLLRGDKEFSTYSRAIFSDLVGLVCWTPAAQDLFDRLAAGPRRSSIWINDLKKLAPELVTVESRKELERIYSLLSKGVHSEFVVAPGARYDRQTISTSINDALKIVARISLLTHFTGYLSFSVQDERAIDLMISIEESDQL